MLRKRMNSQRRETHNRSDEREGGHEYTMKTERKRDQILLIREGGL